MLCTIILVFLILTIPKKSTTTVSNINNIHMYLQHSALFWLRESSNRIRFFYFDILKLIAANDLELFTAHTTPEDKVSTPKSQNQRQLCKFCRLQPNIPTFTREMSLSACTNITPYNISLLNKAESRVPHVAQDKALSFFSIYVPRKTLFSLGATDVCVLTFLQRCNSFYSCEKFTIACTDKYTNFSANTGPSFNWANEKTQHLLHVEKSLVTHSYVIYRCYFSCGNCRV